MMKHRKRVWAIGIVALLSALTVAGLVLAQEDESAAEPSGAIASSTLLDKVAANLGISVDTLVAAFEDARLQSIDEALAAGQITEEQATALKQRIETRQTMRNLVDQALANGEITQEQADLMMGRFNGAQMLMEGPGRFGGALQRGMDCPYDEGAPGDGRRGAMGSGRMGMFGRHP